MTSNMDAMNSNLGRIYKKLDDLKEEVSKLLKEAENIELKKSDFELQTYRFQPWENVADETAFQNLIAHSDLGSVDIATTGSGPWDETEFDVLVEKTYQNHEIADSVKLIVVGYQTDKIEAIRSHLSEYEGVRVYPQELFMSYLLTGVDPLPLLSRPQIEAWIEFHPVLRELFIEGEDFTWNVPGDDVDPEVDQDNFEDETPLSPPQGVTESPLSLLGYSTGKGSALSIEERRDILLEAFNGVLPEISEDEDIDGKEYMAQWGRPKTPRRLWRIARHLSGQYHAKKNNQTQRYAVADWKSDLRWMREELYNESHHTFTWPRMV